MSANQQLLQSYGQMPISFEANAGQTAAQVQYLARGSGYALFLTSTSAVLSLQQSTPAAPNALGASLLTTPPSPASGTGVALAMNLVGANPEASVAGQDQLPGTSNYFIGNDPSQWHTNIANYGQVEYQGVYPGVNLVYYGNQQQLEYDFVVAPGADPGSIRFAIQGADSVSLDGQGNLILSTALGDVLEHAPVVYQEVGGSRQAVAGQFVLLGQDVVGFQVGTYNASLPLTIDPVLSYSTYLGGNVIDRGFGIAVDASGNAYVTGYTTSSNFPTTAGTYQTSFGRGETAFVTKLNASGTALIYSTYLGGSGGDNASGIAVDGSGNAYVTGDTTSTNFPTTVGAFQTILRSSNGNVFVTKLNPTGTALIYSTYLGGSIRDTANAIAVDASGNAYVTGQTYSTTFPTTTSAYQTSLGGANGNAFVTKLNTTGTALIYSTYLGGSGGDNASGIAVDGSGNAYITGSTQSANLPTTVGAFQTILRSSNGNVFVTKLNPTGTALIYSTYLGGSSSIGDTANAIAVDASGNAYVTGHTVSTDFPTTTGAFQTSLAPPGDAFMTKLNSTGTALVYSTYLGGNGGDNAYGIAVDAAGNAYVTGVTSSTDFPTTTGAFQTSYGSFGGMFNGIGGNAFVAKFSFTLATMTTVNTSNATPIYGTAVTLTATVAPASGATVPTQGSVAFFVDGNTSLGAGTFVGSDANNDAIFTYVTGATQLQVAGGVAQSVTAIYTPGTGFSGSSSTNSATETVTPSSLTVSGITASDNVYDGTTAAILNTASAALGGTIFPGDTVVLNTSSAVGTFDTKDIGTGKTVTVSGLTLTGAQASDYTLATPQERTRANITPAPLTVSGLTANNKVFDATTAATLNTASAILAGVFAGDAVTLNTAGTAGTFTSKNVGNNIPVIVTGLTITGPQSSDYTLTQPTPTANITPATVASPALPLIGNHSMLEGSNGLTPFVFRVSLAEALPQPVTYDVYTTGGTAVSSGANSNFVAIAADVNGPNSVGTVSFAPGQVAQMVTVYVIAGTIPVSAGTKDFFVSLSNPNLANVLLATAIGTIIPQGTGGGGGGGGTTGANTLPIPRIGNVESVEGTAGFTPFTFHVSLPVAPAQHLTYDFYTTAGTALAGSNYVTIGAGDNNPPYDIGTVTFAPGQVSQTVIVYVIAGSIPVTAGDQTFYVYLSNPVSLTVPLAVGVGTIIP